MIVALIGLEAGIIGQGIYVVLVKIFLFPQAGISILFQ